MNILVYEHITATWAEGDHSSLSASLLNEGRAMRDSIVTDLKAIPTALVSIAASTAELFAHSHRFDWTMIIAPEFDQILYDLVTRVTNLGGHCLNASPTAIALSSDKLQLAYWWEARHVKTPKTMLPTNGIVQQKTVIKRRDGAGSQDSRILNVGECSDFTNGFIAQSWIDGMAASVSFICSPVGYVPLWPCEQLISTDGTLSYLGGRTIENPKLRQRAIAIATKAINSVPGLIGYVGVDLILGLDGNDWAIEINPRLSTSYVGLRAKATSNLMAAILAAVANKQYDVAWRPEQVEFTADGQCRVVY